MQTTTNYGFSIAEGSDSVNLLTQLYPNFTSLDGILLPIQNNGTTPATHTKAGTVHQLVRTTTGCSVLRFVATGNYTAGDTFTVDGASVTATSCNGQSLPTGAFVINQSVMAIINGAVLTVLAGGSSISDASDVDYNNAVSGLTATNVQDAIDEVYGDIPTSFAGSDVTYNNAVSGLTATDVQTAIDEIALGGGGGGSEHGVIELWVNPDVTSGMPANTTVTITSDKLSTLDSIIIVTCPNTVTGDVFDACNWLEFETSLFPLTGTHWLVASFITAGGSPYFAMCRRKVTSASITGNTLSITFDNGEYVTLLSAGTVNASTNICVPYRILGLIHNN